MATSKDFCAKAFAVMILFLSTGGLVRLLLYPSGASEVTDQVQGDPVTQVMWLGVYGVTALLLTFHIKRSYHIATKDKLLLLLVAIALLSILWSSAPEVTLRRNVALVGTTLTAAYLAMRYSLNELLRLMAWALGIAALLSLIFGLALPSYGIDQASPTGAWQGIFSGGKNELGRNMALSALVFLLMALSVRRRRWLAWAGFSLSVGLLLQSQSQTSLVSFLVVVALLLPYHALRWRYTLSVPTFIVVSLLIGITAMSLQGNAGSLLEAFGKDATLTNRSSEVWPAVLDMIYQRPWLGYGYGAFWLGWSGPSAQVWHWTQAVDPVHAHNGYLDLWLQLGLLGLSIFILQFLLAVQRAVHVVRVTNTTEGLWPLAFLTFLVPYNLSETAILVNNNVFWILYVAIAISTVVLPSKAGKITYTSS